MGNDLISRQAAIEAINALHDKPNAWLDCAVDVVSNLPSAQPEHSAWVNSKDGYSGHVKCKACFKTYDWDSEAQYFNFCPNCGADMRGFYQRYCGTCGAKMDRKEENDTL